MRRYLRLFGVQLRASLLLGMQYRADFLVDGLISIFWTLTAVVPLWVVFERRPQVEGWSFGEALLVVGWFTLLEGVLEGAINPSLTSVVDHIRKGTLDFVLLKPADAQFLVSTSRFEPWRATNVLSASVMVIYGLWHAHRVPTVWGFLEAGLLLLLGTCILYSLWIVTVSAAFYVVRVDNLTSLFTSVFDAARWPVYVFRGPVRLLFTFVIPLALLTTFPAEALLGRLGLGTLVWATLGTAAFVVVARTVWMHSISRYTSASS